MALTTEQWLYEKVESYKKHPKETLENMLVNTTNSIEQYLNSPHTAQKGVLEACLKHNKLFFDEIYKIK